MSRIGVSAGWIGTIMLALPALAQEPARHSMASLSQLRACELEQIYRQAQPGNAPCGFMRGHVVFVEGALLADHRARMVNSMWDGKHFSGDGLINQFHGVRMIKAKVGLGESWLDGRPAHILDYHHTSLLWNDVRDETREVSPGVYVGAMYLRRHFGCPHLKLFFILESCDCR